MICPNTNDPKVKQEFEELVAAIGEDAAYQVWDENNGEAIDMAPNGAPSILFQELLEHYGDRTLAIQGKAKLSSNSFKLSPYSNQVKDENGEVQFEYAARFLTRTNHGRIYKDTHNDEGIPEVTGLIFTDAVTDDVKKWSTSIDNAQEVLLKMEELGAMYGISDFYKNIILQLNSLSKYLGINLSGTKVVYLNSFDNIAGTDGKPSTAVGLYNPNTNTIYINKAYFSETNDIVTLRKTLLHEITHALLQHVIRDNRQLYNELNAIYEDYVKAYPEGGGYASQDVYEFLSELMSESYVSWNLHRMGTEDLSLFQRFINWLRKALGITPDTPMEYVDNVVDLIIEQSALRLLNRQRDSSETDYLPSNGYSELLAKQYDIPNERRIEDLFNQLRQTVGLKLNAFVNHAKLSPSLDAREVASNKKLNLQFDRILKNLGNDSAANIAEYLEGFVDFMLEINSQQTVASNFLNELDSKLNLAIQKNDRAELKRIADAIDNFGKDFFNPNQLMLMRYSDELKREANQNIYRDILDNGIASIDYDGLLENLDFLLNQYSFANVVGNRTLGMRFADLQVKKAKHFLYGEMLNANDPTADRAIRNFLIFDSDISWYTRWMGVFSNEALPLKMLRNLIVRTNRKTEQAVYNRFPKLYKHLSKISKSEMLDMFERDENGRPTGYLVRSVKHGLWSNRIAKFRENWVKSHGLLTLDQVREDPNLYSQFMKDYNAFKAKHVNRRFTNEYYEAFANLKPVTVTALSTINLDIEQITAPFRDNTGTIRLDQMPENVYNEYLSRIEQKRALANKYYYGTDENPGDPKPVGSVDLEIAEDLSALYKKLGENLDKDRTKLDKFWEEHARIKKEGSFTIVNGKPEPSDEVWIDRNSHVVFTEEFEQKMKNNAKSDFGPAYEALYENRRALLNMYRTRDGEPDADRMPEEIKDRIRELDEQLSSIVFANKSGRKRGTKLFVVRQSKQFIARGGNKAAVLDSDFYYNHYGEPTRYSFWNAIEPLNPKAKERIPNNEWLETSPTAGYFNPNYDFTSTDVEQPLMFDKNGKKTDYNNEEAYNKIMNNSRLKAAYDEILAIITESNDMLDYTIYKNNYRLPQVFGNKWHYMSSKGVATGLRDYMIDHLGITDNDTEFGVKPGTMPDGTEILLVPTQYTSMLSDRSAYTTDLTNALMEYYRMALNYKHKSEIKADLNIFQDVLKREGKLEDRDTRTGQVTSVPANAAFGLPRMLEVVEKFIWSNVYGRSRSNQTITIGNHKISTDKLWEHLMSYGRDLRLGWNIRSAISGMVSAFAYYLNEAVSNAGINKGNFLVGLQRTARDIVAMSALRSTGGALTNSKTIALLEYNNLTFNPMENSRNIKRMRAGRVMLKAISPYSVWRIASYIPNSVYTISVYNNYRLVTNKDGSKQFMSEKDYLDFGYHHLMETGDMTDPVFSSTVKEIMRKNFNNNKVTLEQAYDLKDGQLLPNAQYGQYITSNIEDEVTAKLSFVSTHAEGMASQVDRNGLYYYAAISSMAMFRAFIPKNIENTLYIKGFSGRNEGVWNYEKKELAFGTMNAIFYHNIMSGGKTKIARVIPASLIRKVFGISQNKIVAYREKMTDSFNINDKQLDEAITKYSKKFNSQIWSAIFWKYLGVLLVNLFSGVDPDDDKNYWVNLMRLFSYKIGLEASSRYDPSTMLSLLNSVTPLMQAVKDAAGARYVFEAFTDTVGITKKDEIIKRGAYRGLSHAQRSFIKSVPLLNAYYGMKNPAEKLDGMRNALN